MKLAIYIRVSTEDQAKERYFLVTPQGQALKCEKNHRGEDVEIISLLTDRQAD